MPRWFFLRPIYEHGDSTGTIYVTYDRTGIEFVRTSGFDIIGTGGSAMKDTIHGGIWSEIFGLSCHARHKRLWYTDR